MPSKSLSIPLCALLTLAHIHAQEAPKYDAASVQRGKEFFVSHCGFCHGVNAKGGEKGPDLLRSVLVLDDENGSSLGPFLAHGRPDKGMPAFTLTPEQVTDIANFLHRAIYAAADRDTYQVHNIVTGNAQAGEKYFQAHCASCHSPTGDLKGIGKKYDPENLQDNFVMPRPEEHGKPLLTISVTTADGKTVQGVPEHFDDFSVALRDSAGNYYSFKRTTPETPRIEIHNPLQAHYDLLARYTDTDIHNLTAYLVTLK
ncbi:MAG TPA: c-type cytochrome [Bryobacteraceae bacterium]|nr:c-type cytochrome [Bryobacteraceae bacterium]